MKITAIRLITATTHSQDKTTRTDTFLVEIHNIFTYPTKESYLSAVSKVSSGVEWGNENSTQASPFDEATPSAIA